MTVADIEAEMVAIKKVCAHRWRPWLGRQGYCKKCGKLRTKMPPTIAQRLRLNAQARRRAASERRGPRVSEALEQTRAIVERMLST